MAVNKLNCGHCNRSFTSRATGIECYICKNRFHSACAGVNNTAGLKAGELLWVCKNDLPSWNILKNLLDNMTHDRKTAFIESLPAIQKEWETNNNNNKNSNRPEAESIVRQETEAETQEVVNSDSVCQDADDSSPDSVTDSTDSSLGTVTTTVPDRVRQTKRADICKFYVKGICRYRYAGNKTGLECSYHHPKKCLNMLRKGQCRFGSTCRFFHPDMCKTSLEDRKCYDLSCPYFHVKGTERYIESGKQDNEFGGNSNNFLYQAERDFNRGNIENVWNWMTDPLAYQDHRYNYTPKRNYNYDRQLHYNNQHWSDQTQWVHA